MKYVIFILLIFASCKQKEKENLIVGKWEYEKMERFDSVTINLQDSLFNDLHQRQTGMTFSLSKNNIFKVTQKKENGREEFIAEQKYELPEDKKILRLINTGRPDDNFPIIELSDSLLKINIFYSDKAYMVFRKKE